MIKFLSFNFNTRLAAAGLCEWIVNIIMYYDVVVTVEPKKKALREATETLEAANTKLAEVNALVADLEAKLAVLIADLDKALAEKDALMAEAKKSQDKLDLASVFKTFSYNLCQN